MVLWGVTCRTPRRCGGQDPTSLGRIHVRLKPALACTFDIERAAERVTLAAEQMLVIDFDSQKRAFLFR